MKVAIIHDWLVTYGGAEVFLEYLLKIYSDADIFTLVYDKKRIGNHFTKNHIITSGLQKIPFSTRLYGKLLPLMPHAAESFDLSSYDLVISSSSCCAKGVITSPLTPHVAFIHSPMRYAWDLFFDYKKRSGFLTRFFMDRFMKEVREWDYISAQRIDLIIANSRYIARRIKKFWGRDSRVIYLPVDTSRFSVPLKDGTKVGNSTASIPQAEAIDGEIRLHSNLTYNNDSRYYIAFSRLVPYKRIDIALNACKRLGRRLIIIGSGPQERTLKKLAASSPLITFTGRVSDEDLSGYLHNARALLFCAEEDYGFVPLEAQSCGCPVIAYNRGGACETVIDNVTGLFFNRQTADSLIDALIRFESKEPSFNKDAIIAHAKSNTFENFRASFLQAVEDAKLDTRL